MRFVHIYAQLLKNKANYNIIFSNFKYNIIFNLTLKYGPILKLNDFCFFKLFKKFLIENGFKALLFKNWLKFGIKQDIVTHLLTY